MEKDDVYAACDRAIRYMDRWCLREFGKLKTMKWDELEVMKKVVAVYRKSAEMARKRYRDIGEEIYLLFYDEYGEGPAKVRQVITAGWVDELLAETNPVTLYRFDTEMERKAYRLAEALAVAQNRDAEIDRALRAWTKQLAQYAINVTDEAAIRAMDDAGIEKVQWFSQRDNRVCGECHALNGLIFLITEIPPKPHTGCRCFWRPVLEK